LTFTIDSVKEALVTIKAFEQGILSHITAIKLILAEKFE
jgi:hypothetical protein